jgi:hypothetical protein
MIIEMAIAAAAWMAPLPAVEQAQQVRIVNVSAARKARDLPAEWQDFTLCISARESGYGKHHDTSKSYRAKNPASTASGRYQFLDSSWRKGGAWNVWKRLIKHGYTKATAAKVRERLMETPIRYWKPVYQDILYAEVILSNDGKGWKHWYLAGSPCNSKVPA